MPITASLINRYTKFHWGLNEFSAHFGVTPDQFEEMFEKTFSGKKRDDLWRKIQKNSKKSNQASSHKATSTYSDSSLETDSLDSETQVTITEQYDNSETDSEITTEIVELEKAREELATLICGMEESHVALNARRRHAFVALAQHKVWISEYYEALKKHATEVAELSTLTYQLSDELKQLSSAIALKKQELAIIDERIELSKRVAILCYSDGEIEVENSKEEIPENWHEIYTALLEYEMADELKIKEIKQVAKALAFTQKLSNADIFFDLTFENETSQRLYDAYPLA